MRTAWHCGNVAPMRADAALARLRDVSHRSASHRCSARRNAPSRSPTLPTRPDLDVEPLRLETGEAAGDGLEPLADASRWSNLWRRSGVDEQDMVGDRPNKSTVPSEECRLNEFFSSVN